MTLDEITTRAAALLQDTSNVRWTVPELRQYAEDSQQEWLRLAEYPRTTGTQSVVLGNTTIAVPPTISVVKLVRLQGLQLQIVTSSQLDQKHTGQHPSSGIGGWLASTGTPLYLVQDQRNATTLRIVPYPTENAHLTSLTTRTNNVTSPTDTTSALVFVVNSLSDTGVVTNAPVYGVPASVTNAHIIYTQNPSFYFVGAQVVSSALPADTTVTAISTTLTGNGYAITLDKNAIATSTDADVAIISTNTLLENTATVGGWVWTVEGVVNSKLTFRDPSNTDNYLGTAQSVLPDMYSEALVYGTLERAFLKENELRNLEKSQIWRSKFYEIVVDCQRREGQNDMSHTEGVDRMTMTVPFPRRYGRRLYGPSWSPTTLTNSSS